MAVKPKDHEFIYGTKPNYVRTQRERRDDAIRKSETILPKIPKTYPVPTPSPALPRSTSLPDGATPSAHGSRTNRPAGKPLDFANIAAFIGGVLGAVYAAAHGVTSGLGLGFAFVLSSVAAGTIFAYAKWVIAILFLAGLVYTLSQ